MVRSTGHELDATARFALPILAHSSGCRPSAPESSISRCRPTLPRDGPAGAPAAPRPGRAASGASSSRPLLEPASAAIAAGHAFLHKRKGGRDRNKAGAAWTPLATVNPFGHAPRRSGQPHVLDHSADNCTRFGVRGVRILDRTLLDLRSPGLSGSCSRSCRAPRPADRQRPGLDPAPVDNSHRLAIPLETPPSRGSLSSPSPSAGDARALDSWSWSAPRCRPCNMS